MPFFIPNRTKCAICHQPIENRFEAAELPYIDPAASSSLSQLARNFVHRHCWNEWENAKFYAHSAFHLAKTAENQNTAFKIEFEGDELIVFWIAALNNYQLKDFNLLATVELPLESSPAILNFLISVLSQPDITEEYQFEDYIWKARWVDANIELTLFEDMETIDKILLPKYRHSIWIAALKVILNKVTEKLGEVAVNQNYAMLP